MNRNKCGGIKVSEKKYQKVKEFLLENIKNGTYVPELPIPPERELAASLGVNRMTLRKAVEELMYDGYLIRKKGSGTYLTREKVRKDELIAADETEDHVGSGHEIRFLSCKLHHEGSYGFKNLELPEKGKEGYWRIRRVRSLDMVPYAYEDIYLREFVFPNVDESYYSMGLHEIIKEKAGEEHPFRQQQVEALLCLKTTGDILNVNVGSPILQVKTWFYSAKEPDKILLYCRSYHPGDSYTFRSRKVVIK